jgi:predicted transposase YdaD
MQERGGPRPFDVATRTLIETDPAGWLRWLGLPLDGPVQAIDTEISTVLAEVDKVLRIEAPAPWLAHLELQSSRDQDLPLRLLEYNAILRRRHKVRVRSTVVLLRRQADGRELTGVLEDRESDDDTLLVFKYRIVKLWERPVDELLGGSIGVLPLAPLADFEEAQLSQVLDHLGERFDREAPSQAGDLWAATALLMGVRYHEDAIRDLIQKVRRMRESVTYQIILEEGREEGEIREARRTLLRLGAARFGRPATSTAASIEAMEDLDTLHRMVEALLGANSWQELLAVGQG